MATVAILFGAYLFCMVSDQFMIKSYVNLPITFALMFLLLLGIGVFAKPHFRVLANANLLGMLVGTICIMLLWSLLGITYKSFWTMGWEALQIAFWYSAIFMTAGTLGVGFRLLSEWVVSGFKTSVPE